MQLNCFVTVDVKFNVLSYWDKYETHSAEACLLFNLNCVQACITKDVDAMNTQTIGQINES